MGTLLERPPDVLLQRVISGGGTIQHTLKPESRECADSLRWHAGGRYGIGTHPQFDVQRFAHCAEYRRQVVHGWVAGGRKHPVQALAVFVGDVRKCLEADRRVYEISKNHARRVWLTVEEERRCLGRDDGNLDAARPAIVL